MKGCANKMPEKEITLEQCDYMHLHTSVIKQVQKELPAEETLYDLAELFKVFGDSTRIKFYTYCLNLKCVYVILRSFCI